MVAVLVAAAAPMARAAPAQAPCVQTAMPYQGIPGASFAATEHVSVDDPPVPYVRWRGTVPGYDGMPFSVDVTVPCSVEGPQPTLVMAHGFTDDKTIWQETDKSNSVLSATRPATNSRWNNVWFVSRGYTIVNYTARGWHDSCGPDTPGATPVTPAPQCLPYEYWIHLDDKRWEVRDAQWLAGALVQSGLADPARLAITGGSYGGAPTAMAALLAGTTMCGGAPVPPALGPDPCTGHADGALVPWTTPDGSTPLTWAASVPLYTFADLIQVLAPNGRGTDGWEHAPPDGDHAVPFGIPIAGTIAGLLAAGNLNGFFAPPLIDPDADIVTDSARILAGPPFPVSDPLVARGIRLYRDFKSPITTTPQGRVPIFWVQGLTDALFPGLEALQVLEHVRRHDAGYPMKLFLGDVGHDYSGERQDEWDLVHEPMNAFLDHYLRPDRTPAEPLFDVTSTITRCLNHDAPPETRSAPTWHELHPEHVTLASTSPGMTSSVLPGPSGLATDPISTATLPLPGSYKGCRIVRPAAVDPTNATYEFALDRDLVLMGGPVLEIAFATTGPDTQLNVRMWDVTPDGGAQGLVTRGTYRVAEGPGTGYTARFQLWPQGYRFEAGHTIRVEIAANDFPYRQANTVPSIVTVDRMAITLPLAATPAPTATGLTLPAGDPLPATGGEAPLLPLVLTLAAATAVLRRFSGR
jgi:predicted acyl esterase